MFYSCLAPWQPWRTRGTSWCIIGGGSGGSLPGDDILLVVSFFWRILMRLNLNMQLRDAQ